MFLKKNGYLNSIFPKKVLRNSQDLDKLYYDAGLFYFFNINNIKKYNDFKNTKKILPFFVNDETDGIDIDTYQDWERFKKIFSSKL